MTMGSFLLPSDPASNNAPPVAGSRPGSATAALARAAKTTAAAPPAARRRDPSRRPRIAMHPGVDVRQQAHVLRAHLDLHAVPAHVECAPVDGHVARRRDQVVRPIVGRLLGLELHVVELDSHVTAQRDRAHLVAFERDAALAALQVRLAALLLHEERHPRLEDDDLVLLLEELRVPRRDLPHHPPVLHLHPAKVLDTLRDLGQEVAAKLLERVHPMSDHVAGDQVSDDPEGGAHHDEQRGAHPFPSHGRSNSGAELARVSGRVKANAAQESARAAVAAEGRVAGADGCLRQRSCHHTHSAGLRRICASIAAVRRAVSSRTPSRPRGSSAGSGDTRTRCPPPGRRSMKTDTTGTRARSARSAAPGGVCAWRPKKATKSPGQRVSWSIIMATTRFLRSASPTAATKRGSSRTRTSTPAAARKRMMSEWKRRSFTRRTTTVIG